MPIEYIESLTCAKLFDFEDDELPRDKEALKRVVTERLNEVSRGLKSPQFDQLVDILLEPISLITLYPDESFVRREPLSQLWSDLLALAIDKENIVVEARMPLRLRLEPLAQVELYVIKTGCLIYKLIAEEKRFYVGEVLFCDLGTQELTSLFKLKNQALYGGLLGEIDRTCVVDVNVDSDLISNEFSPEVLFLQNELFRWLLPFRFGWEGEAADEVLEIDDEQEVELRITGLEISRILVKAAQENWDLPRIQSSLAGPKAHFLMLANRKDLVELREQEKDLRLRLLSPEATKREYRDEQLEYIEQNKHEAALLQANISAIRKDEGYKLYCGQRYSRSEYDKCEEAVEALESEVKESEITPLPLLVLREFLCNDRRLYTLFIDASKENSQRSSDSLGM